MKSLPFKHPIFLASIVFLFSVSTQVFSVPYVDPPRSMLVPMCTAEAGLVKKGNDCVAFKNGCEKSRLESNGYISVSSCDEVIDVKRIVLAAFYASADVKKEINNLFLSLPAHPDLNLLEPEIVLTAYGCGFVGCAETYLVIQKISYTGTNPFINSFMATVHLDAFGRKEVKIVTLTDAPE